MKKKGILTREKIVTAAKYNFMKYGYNQTRIQSIADDAGIALGSLSFYFKKKEDLAGFILYEYLNKFYEYIQHVENKNDIEWPYLHAAASIPYYLNIYNDISDKQFYTELLQAGSPYLNQTTNTFSSVTFIIRKALISMSLNHYDDEIMKLFSHFGTVGRNALALNFMTGNFTIDPVTYVNTITAASYSVFGLSNEDISRCINYANDFHSKHKMEHIHLLWTPESERHCKTCV